MLCYVLGPHHFCGGKGLGSKREQAGRKESKREQAGSKREQAGSERERKGVRGGFRVPTTSGRKNFNDHT